MKQSIVIAWLGLAGGVAAYPPGVGILGPAKSCLVCHESKGPWSDETRTIVDVLDAGTRQSLKAADGTFRIEVPRHAKRKILTVIGRQVGDREKPRRNAWLYVDPAQIEAVSLSKFPPGWEVNLPMACRLTGDPVEGVAGEALTSLPMTIRPTDAARDVEIELQVMVTTGEPPKGTAAGKTAKPRKDADRTGLTGNYLVRRIRLVVIDTP